MSLPEEGPAHLERGGGGTERKKRLHVIKKGGRGEGEPSPIFLEETVLSLPVRMRKERERVMTTICFACRVDGKKGKEGFSSVNSV